MPNASPQSLAHHTRYDPLFHFFVLPVFAITLLISMVNLVRRPGLHSTWLVVFMIAALFVVFKVRLYPLKVQDRVIRLEERLRLLRVLPERLRPRVEELTEPQIIALRFASDAELAGLVEKALAGSSNADIKKAIVNWRPDYYRA